MSVRREDVPPGHERVFVGHVPRNTFFQVLPTSSGALALPVHNSHSVVDHPNSYAKVAAKANAIQPVDRPKLPVGSHPFGDHETAEGLVGIKVGSEFYMGSTAQFRAVKDLLAQASDEFRRVLHERYGAARYSGTHSRQFSARVDKVTFKLLLKYELTSRGTPYEIDVVAVMDELRDAWQVYPVIVDSWNGHSRSES